MRIKLDKENASNSSNEAFTRSKTPTKQNQQLCIFCDQPENTYQKLTTASTVDVDIKVRRTAEYTGDSKLLARLACGDMVAIGAKY